MLKMKLFFRGKTSYTLCILDFINGGATSWGRGGGGVGERSKFWGKSEIVNIFPKWFPQR